MNEYRTKRRLALLSFVLLATLTIAAWRLIPIINATAPAPSIRQVMMEATKPRLQNGLFTFSLKRESFRIPAGYLAGAWHDHSGVLNGASFRAAWPEFFPAGRLGRPTTVKNEIEMRLQVRQGDQTLAGRMALEGYKRGDGVIHGQLEIFPLNDRNSIQQSFADWEHNIHLLCDEYRPSCQGCLRWCHAHQFGGPISLDFRFDTEFLNDYEAIRDSALALMLGESEKSAAK